MAELRSQSPYYQIQDTKTDFDAWWKQYKSYQSDYMEKGDTELFPYILEIAPKRWYSRLVLNLYAPVARNTIKFFFPVSIDYESFILGGLIGTFIACRHFLDYRLCKSSQLRPGDSFCTGQNNHFYRKWEATRVNPRKYFNYDQKIFWRKLVMSIPHAIMYGMVSCGIVHQFYSQTYPWNYIHFPLFLGTTWVTYDLYVYDQNYEDIDYNFYKHAELYILGLLTLYNICRQFRSYVNKIPSARVLIG